ncbi:ATPase [Craurococcus roseus]|uniref:ATPase n=1 Tax=Craurococcus roseus TaxID=77585 RepID=A0ABP3Q165_9PROT
MKRFWDRATVGRSPEGYSVLLDGRPVRLPGGAPFTVWSERLAEAVAAEWDAAGGAKGGEMSFNDVPLTRLAGTAQERIAPDPAPVAEALARYAETDLLCYFADDPRLAAIQAEEWQPLLDWAARRHDALLRVTAGLMPVAQGPDALAALRRAVSALGALDLAALGVLVPAFGSLVLGLAVVDCRLEAAEALRLATLDEIFQERFWGTDAEAEARRARVAADVEQAARLLALARGAA